MGQEGGAAHEKDRESGETDVGHLIGAIRQWASAPVGQTGTDHAQFGNPFLKGAHTLLESTFESRRKGQSLQTAGGRTEIRKM